MIATQGHRGARRGQADMLPWIVRLVTMLIGVIVIVMLVRAYTDRDVQSPELHRAAYLYRVYYDGNVIMYTDPVTKRVYPGVVDVDKFTSDHLDGVFAERLPGQEWSKISSCMNLTLYPGCPFQLSAGGACNNYKTFLLYAPFEGVGGGQGSTVERATFAVNARKGNQECGATLNITIVRPNS